MQNGGATYTHTDLNVIDSTISGCNAQRGGAVYVSSGSASLARSTVSNCSASESGGGLYSAGGSAALSEGTLISGCSAEGEGNSIFLFAGEVSYALPAPAGRWLPNARCEVYRGACSYRYPQTAKQAACLEHRDNCKLANAATPSEEEKRAACRRHSDPTKKESCLERVAEMWYCQAATNVQPCNWEDDPSLLGKNLYQLPLRPVDQDFPFACAAGLLGSADPEDQSSSSCAGRCPAGSQCPEEATYETQPCDAGHYCPVGTSVPRPCLAGTFSNATNLTAAGECTDASPGHFATIGATTEPTPCSPGSFAAKEGQSKCDHCPAGSQCPEEATYEAQPCVAGHYCPVGTSVPRPCPAGSYSNGTNLTAASECTVASSGYFATIGATEPTPCSPGSFAAKEGQAKCESCARGASSGEGSGKCYECEAGSYAANAGQDLCFPCPHPLSSVNGSVTCSICKADHYLHISTPVSDDDIFNSPTYYCQPCPSNADCSTNTTLETLGVPRGYWRASPLTTEIHKCDVSKHCSGSGSASEVEIPSGPRLADSGPGCDTGHTGPLCEWCVNDEQYFSSAESGCVDCPTTWRFGILAGVIVALSGVVLLSCRALVSTEAWGRFSARLDIIESQVGPTPQHPRTRNSRLLHVTCLEAFRRIGWKKPVHT